MLKEAPYTFENNIVLIEKGRLKCKLPFLKVSDCFDFIGAEFYTPNRELICANYIDMPNENGVSKILGFGMIGEYIGMGVGGKYFMDSLVKLSKVHHINSFMIWKSSCNTFSREMLIGIKEKINTELIRDISFSENEHELIIKIKDN